MALSLGYKKAEETPQQFYLDYLEKWTIFKPIHIHIVLHYEQLLGPLFHKRVFHKLLDKSVYESYNITQFRNRIDTYIEIFLSMVFLTIH